MMLFYQKEKVKKSMLCPMTNSKYTYHLQLCSLFLYIMAQKKSQQERKSMGKSKNFERKAKLESNSKIYQIQNAAQVRFDYLVN